MHRLIRRLPLPVPSSQPLRAKITVLVGLLTVLLLTPLAVLASMLIQQMVTSTAWKETRQQVIVTQTELRAGRLTDPIEPSVPGVDLVQVVDAKGRVIAASEEARSLPPLASTLPTPDEPQRDLQSCPQDDAGPCMRVSALRVDGASSPTVIYAGRPASALTEGTNLNLILAAQVALVTLLTGWGTWKLAGGILRPINDIRGTLNAINVNDISARVPTPDGDDEIIRLAHTVNDTLDRIEHAKQVTERLYRRQREFTADASHELRTPLAGIRARLEDAKLHPAETDLEELVDGALGDVERLQAIIDDLLFLTRVCAADPRKMELIDLGELVRAETAARECPVEVRLDLDGLTTIKAVRNEIARAYVNLIDNAQRHAKRIIEVEVRTEGTYVVVSVGDDGPGVPEDKREWIFERFARLDSARSRDRGGTGLGLTIVRDIAVAHGGTVTVDESRYGGARFVVRLPLVPGYSSPDGAGPADADRRPSAAPHRGG